MGSNPRNLRELDIDVGESGRESVQARTKSITALVFPIGVVVSIIGGAATISFALGQSHDELHNVVDTVKEIKSEMYRRSDAEALNLKVEFLDRRVTALEAVRQHHVDVVTAKVEKQEDDIITRAQHWLTGGGKK